MKTYRTAKAFRMALEAKLKQKARTQGLNFDRMYKKVAFDRFLARIFNTLPPAFVMKGGYALEIRAAAQAITAARATKDIDLTSKDKSLFDMDIEAQNQFIFQKLQQCVSQPLNDYFEFYIGEPTLELENTPYGGGRFPVEAKMDGRTFTKFHVDVGVGDVIIEPLETLTPTDWLDFAGIPTVNIYAISKEQQLAEKLHAYTLPRDRNSRTKDLVDIYLLTNGEPCNLKKVWQALEMTFKRRKTHAIPKTLSPPPSEWAVQFIALAKDCQIETDYLVIFEFVRAWYQRLVEESTFFP
jgi:hypothetical protein